MTIELINHPFGYQIETIIRLFFPGTKMTICKEESDFFTTPVIGTKWISFSSDPEIDDWSHFIRPLESCYPTDTLLRNHLLESPLSLQPLSQQELTQYLGYFTVWIQMDQREETCSLLVLKGTDTDEQERILSRLLFGVLCRNTGLIPPWGMLTGVRPVRLFSRQLPVLENSFHTANTYFANRYYACKEKVSLTLETEKNQAPLLRKNTSNTFSLYVGIPFCPSRCQYCSFISHDIAGSAKLVPDYIRLLCQEIEVTADTAQQAGLQLQSIYIGGGTPTSLSAPQLEEILKTIQRCFDLSHLLEYTVEAGRPDTITPEKLQVLHQYGVERISINPQTLDDNVLQAIGRNHTAQQFLEAFELARQVGFQCINTDLIAGLPKESSQGFLSGLQQIIDLRPENITVHTLTIKRSSALRDLKEAFQSPAHPLCDMLDRTWDNLQTAGYLPYYLYRQKGTLENLENVGWALPQWESLYNVFIMEEVQTILGVGSGAVTKLVRENEKIQRIYNFKYPLEYIQDFQTMIARKKGVIEFYEGSFR